MGPPRPNSMAASQSELLEYGCVDACCGEDSPYIMCLGAVEVRLGKSARASVFDACQQVSCGGRDHRDCDRRLGRLQGLGDFRIV